MAKSRLKIADLDEGALGKVRQMESAMGTLILALEPHYPMAELSEEQVELLKKLEDELGVFLVAYKP